MNRKNNKAILVVLGCCLLYAATGGIGANCRGIFFNPVSTSLGVPLSEMNFAGILSGIASAIVMPISCKLYHKLPDKLYLSFMVGIFSLSQFLLGNTTTVIWFYMMSILQGVTCGFINMYVIQTVISNWYPNRKGTLLGMVAMSTGIAGAIMNPVITGWIELLGWQTAYRICGIIILIMTFPTALFLVHRDPAEVDCEPVTAGNASKRVSIAEPVHTTRLDILLAIVFVAVAAVLNALAQHLANFAILAGFSASFGAILVSSSMFGNIIGKAIMGVLNDKLGARPTSLLVLLPIILACFGILVVSSPVIMCLCAFFIGIIMALNSVQIPMICRSCFVPDVYLKIYPTICSVNILLSASSASVLSFLLNIDNTYTPVILFSAALLILCVLAVLALELLQRRHASVMKTNPEVQK